MVHLLSLQFLHKLTIELGISLANKRALFLLKQYLFFFNMNEWFEAISWLIRFDIARALDTDCISIS